MWWGNKHIKTLLIANSKFVAFLDKWVWDWKPIKIEIKHAAGKKLIEARSILLIFEGYK